MVRAGFATLDGVVSHVLTAAEQVSKGLQAFLFLLIAGAVLLRSLLVPAPAQAQTTVQPFEGCTSDVYLAQNIPTRMYRVNTATNPFSYPALGSTTHSAGYNAIAFNPADKYIYGVDRPSGSNIRLLRIGRYGGYQVVGTITGGNINVPTTYPASGEIGADGYYYIKHNAATDGALYRVNLSTRAATRINMSQARASADLAWYNGKLYAHDSSNDRLYTINPSNGQVQVIGSTGVSGTFGALVSASNGVFGIRNEGGFYQFNLQTGKATLISSSPATSNNDGAKCYSTPLQFGADLSITKTDNTTYYTPGTSTTYSIVVRNNGPFGVQGAIVNDPLPSGITSASWTCGSATNGGVCGQASGTGGISNVAVDLPVNATVTFTMTMQIPSSFTGDLTNKATVTAPETALDSNQSNNTATDKDVGVRISKALFAENGSVSGQAEPGEELTYRITLTNTGTSAATNYSLVDTLDANTTFVSASNGGTHSSGTVTWSNLSVPAGGSLTLTVVVQVKNALPASARTITNIARNPKQSTPSCPSAQCVVTPLAPKVTFSKTSNATQAKVGDVIRYTLTATVANGTTNNALTLTDTLGTGLTFKEVTSAGAFTADTSGAPVLTFTLPAGRAPGTYSVSYTATVNEDATGTVTNTVVGAGGDNPSCTGSCTTTATIIAPQVTFAKSADTAGPVKVGDVITYTITTTVSNSMTTSDVVLLTDTLGTGLTFTEVVDQGAYTVNQINASVVEFRLPPSMGPGTYPITYKATVNASASGEVSNAVVGSGADAPSCTTGCGTTTVVQDTAVTYTKTASTSGPVKAGDVITYTLSATVEYASTKNELTLTDTLGEGLDFGTVTNAGAFTCNAESPLICTLPAGRPVGTYSLTYTAIVKDDASGSVTNAVVGTGDDNPSCTGSCSTTTPVADPVITYAKTSSATQAKVGDVITYTLTATIADAATNNVLTLTDMPGEGLEITDVTDAGDFTCTSGSTLICTLPAGTPVGTYSLTYTATVKENASGTVTNTVVGMGGNPTCAGSCAITTPVVDPAVTYAKSASTSGPVKAGDVITYTLMATVADAATKNTLTLTDTLGAGLDFTAVTSAGEFTCTAGNPLVCTLPAGTPAGSYSITYTATVNASASGSVTNAVVGTGGDSPACSGTCTTTATVDNPTVTYTKSANATQVRVGDVVTYTLKATVANAATKNVLTLTDTLGAGLTFNAVTSAGAFNCTAGNPLVCTLPVGTPAGTYSVTYTATVNASASGSVSNAVVGAGGDNPTCAGSCTTTATIIAPQVTFSKTASTSGPVKAGDVITYTLTTTIANAKTTSDVVLLTDTLGAGLEFTAVTNAGAYSVDASGAPVVKFRLPAGTGPGTYSVTYTATVKASASGTVSNVVVGSGGDHPSCTTGCSTTTTVQDPAVTYAKSASTSGPVKAGDVITYTLTAKVENAATKNALTLTDTLGEGLDFTTITDAGAYSVDVSGAPMVRFTLPAGTPAGTYAVTYTATVTDSAAGSVVNSVVGTGGDHPTCSGTCATTTPVADPVVTYAKSANATQVKVGDVITYTLTATVADGATRNMLTLTDTLGAGLDFTAVVSTGPFICTPANPLVCTLPPGTPVGSYSVVYTATVNASASGTVTNAVVGTGGDNPACSGSCTTTANVVAPEVLFSKTASTAGPVKAGDVITYTLTTTISNSKTTSDVVLLTDTLGTGLTFKEVTNAGAYTVDASDAPVVRFRLPEGTGPGTYSVTYTATVNTTASGTVANVVVGSGADSPSCTTSCGTTTSVANPSVTYAKAASTAGPVQAGDVITYTLTVTVANAATRNVLTLTDTLGTGLDLDSVTDAGAFTCTVTAPLMCTLPAGTPVGTYEVTYTAVVNGGASDVVTNAVVGAGGDNPLCSGICSTTTTVADPTVTYSKSANATQVKVGDAITYTLRVNVAGAATKDVLTLTDTLGAGLTFNAVTSPGAFTCTGSSTLVCTLPAGTPVGTYEVTYVATVNAAATGSVVNTVAGAGGDNPSCAGGCSVTTPVIAPEVFFSKMAVTSTPVKAGDVITYMLTTTVSNSMTTSDVVLLTDTLGTGLTFREVTNAGAYQVDASGAPVVKFRLPQGTGPGTYSVTYTATVNGAASGAVSNVVVGSGADNPVCTTACGTTTAVEDATVVYAKTASTTGPVKAGDVITYTLTTTVANSVTTSDTVLLTDTLGTGLDFKEVTNAGAYQVDASGAPVVRFILPAGTGPGTYAVTYTATVNGTASGDVRNNVVGSGADNPVCLDVCTVRTPVTGPVIHIVKSADPAAGETVQVGDTITYALTATVSNGATTEPLVLVDTPDAGLTITEVPELCEIANGVITCTLPAGTPVGAHRLTYTATVNADVGDTVRNQVTASGGGAGAPSCDVCAVEHKVEQPLVRLVKTASVREVKIGDLIRYTLSLENVSQRDLIGGSIIDIPPAGFTYVEGSLRVVDSDNAATVSGQSPLRFGSIDLRAGETATLVYLMRVGAGVRKGTHVNQAQVYGSDNVAVSNRATAQVELVADPLLDDTLIFGTVFDDRDGDGWQDSAALTGLSVKGGFAPEAYIPGSTTIDRGQGMTPVPDASAPLLHGLRLGSLSARQSDADPVERHRIVIRQRLSALAFTDDFILTSDQGVTVRMNAAGETRIEKSGEAAKGLNAAEPRVTRRVAQGEGGYVVDYIIDNAGIDERGIPGVRIASVEGLIMETDQFGRYHLEGIPGGAWERGRNFILKVDPATLPDGATFTTANPLLRRITPGIPVRFDWGVKLPSVHLEGTQTIELELGSVAFAPGSAEIREKHLPAIEAMAAKLREFKGGEVVIDASGTTEALAFERAEAVKAALLPRLDPASAPNVRITARGRVDDPSAMIVGFDEGGALLGTVLFDTGTAEIRPEFGPLLDRMAAWLAQQGGGAVTIVGHADVRGSFEDNTALGMRRARAVYDALAGRLSPDVRANIRVEQTGDPAAAIGTHGK
ncbi:isopeptide-forming domain-containing fimbrial protein [Pedomonas sp. V897]|uniref:isopeptide-forming domain-containing fimbrial protein n=1 Tax=Pedomonas sp. V897 TaxID=3446482 RepID=UPI003EE3297C